MSYVTVTALNNTIFTLLHYKDENIPTRTERHQMLMNDNSCWSLCSNMITIGFSHVLKKL